MAKTLGIVAGLAVLTVVSIGSVGGPLALTQTDPVIPEAETVVGIPGAQIPPGYWGLPWCSQVHGTSCSPPDSITRCLLAPGEPEICICQASGTWKCCWT